MPPVASPPSAAWLHSHFLQWAGGTRFVYEVARRVHRRRPLDMIVERCAPAVRAMYDAEGMRVIEIADRSSTSMRYWAAFPLYLRRDARRLRGLAGDYSAFVSSMFPMNYLASISGVAHHLTYVMEPFAFFHDADMIAGFPPFRRLLLRLLASCYRRLDVRGVQDAGAIMTINDGTAAWVRSIYGRDSTTSLLGVDATVFAPRADAKSEALRRRYAGRKLVIHSTDFTPLKRTAAAIDAIASIREDVPAVKLLVTCSVENPAAIAALRQRVREHGLGDHVEFVGHLSHEDLPCYYALADVSLYTGIGRGASAASLFVLECMACGTPGVRTRFTEEEVEHGVSGFLFDPEDTAALRHLLTRILTDDGLRASFSHAARARILARYSWDAVAGRVLHGLDALEAAGSPNDRSVVHDAR